MSFPKSFVFFCLLLTTSMVHAQQVAKIRTLSSDGLQARFGLSAVTLDGKIYTMGGDTSVFTNLGNETKTRTNLTVYDPSLDQWTTPPTINTCLGGDWSNAVVIEGKIYSIGLNDTVNLQTMEIRQYDPESGSWDPMPNSLLKSRLYFGVIAVGNEIYCLGGVTPFIGYYDSITVYNVQTHEHSTFWAEGPAIQRISRSVTCQGKAYFIGASQTYEDSILVFDPTTRSVAEVRSTGTFRPRDYFTSAALEDKIYVFGGYWIDGNEPATTVDVFDTKTNAWSEVDVDPAPFPRNSLAAIPLNGKIYLIGGSHWKPNSEMLITTNTTEVFEPQSLSVHDADVSTAIAIYPNPTGGPLTINVTSPAEIAIYTALGQAIEQRHVASQSTFDLSNRPSGIYTVLIRNGDQTHISKIAVQ
jgi:N-acetylneuraminic acid mutarotase